MHQSDRLVLQGQVAFLRVLYGEFIRDEDTQMQDTCQARLLLLLLLLLFIYVTYMI